MHKTSTFPCVTFFSFSSLYTFIHERWNLIKCTSPVIEFLSKVERIWVYPNNRSLSNENSSCCVSWSSKVKICNLCHWLIPWAGCIHCHLSHFVELTIRIYSSQWFLGNQLQTSQAFRGIKYLPGPLYTPSDNINLFWWPFSCISVDYISKLLKYLVAWCEKK